MEIRKPKKSTGLWLIEENGEQKICDVDSPTDHKLLASLVKGSEKEITDFLFLSEARCIKYSLVKDGNGFRYVLKSNHDFLLSLLEFLCLSFNDKQKRIEELKNEVSPTKDQIIEGKWLKDRLRYQNITRSDIKNMIEKSKKEIAELEELLEDDNKWQI